MRDVCPRQRKEAREETTMAELLIMGPGFNAAQISLVIGLARPVNSSWTCVKQLQHIGLVCCMLTNAALLLKVPQLHAGSGSRHNRANPETRTLNPKQAVRRAGKEPGERGALAHAQAGLHRGAHDPGSRKHVCCRSLTLDLPSEACVVLSQMGTFPSAVLPPSWPNQLSGTELAAPARQA